MCDDAMYRRSVIASLWAIYMWACLSVNVPCYIMQRSFEFKKDSGEKVKEDVTVDVNENYVQYHVRENEANELWVIEDYNRVRTPLHLYHYILHGTAHTSTTTNRHSVVTGVQWACRPKYLRSEP